MQDPGHSRVNNEVLRLWIYGNIRNSPYWVFRFFFEPGIRIDQGFFWGNARFVIAEDFIL